MPIVEMCDECNARAGTCNCYDWEKAKECEHDNLEYYNHGYHAICKNCKEQVY